MIVNPVEISHKVIGGLQREVEVNQIVEIMGIKLKSLLMLQNVKINVLEEIIVVVVEDVEEVETLAIGVKGKILQSKLHHLQNLKCSAFMLICSHPLSVHTTVSISHPQFVCESTKTIKVYQQM